MQIAPILSNALKVLLALILYAIAGRLTLGSEQYIEITAQSLVILSIVYLLKPKAAILSILLYLGLGAVGLPIFKDGAGGVSSLMSNTGGYLVGFLIATVYMKMLFEQGKHSYTWYKVIAIFASATLILLLAGTARLGYLIGVEKAITFGFIPFLLPGLIKSVLSTLIVIGFRYLYIRFFEKQIT